jgi:hypothetical protein
LAELGYEPGLDARPVRFGLATASGHELDPHPLHVCASGAAWQAADDAGGRASIRPSVS